MILVDVSRSMASDIADVKGAVLDMLDQDLPPQAGRGRHPAARDREERERAERRAATQYEHITTLRNMAKVDFDALRTVHDELEADSGAADLVDGIGRLHLLLGFVRKLKFAKRRSSSPAPRAATPTTTTSANSRRR